MRQTLVNKESGIVISFTALATEDTVLNYVYDQHDNGIPKDTSLARAKDIYHDAAIDWSYVTRSLKTLK